MDMGDIDEKKLFLEEDRDMEKVGLNGERLDPPADLTFDDDKSTADLADETTSDKGVPEWLEGYVEATQAHLQNLRALIKYTKTKDESIYKLSNELQKYREDYCAKTFKPIGMAIISFREDCRKSMGDIKKYQYDVEKVSKYLDFLADDYFEMLSNVGIEEGDDGWLFNGSLIKQFEVENAPVLARPFQEMTTEEEGVQASIPNVKNADDLLAYLSAVENEVKAILAKNEALDKCLKAYIEFSFNVEKNLVKVLVLPAVRTLVTIGEKLRCTVDELRGNLTDEDCNQKYEQCLENLVNALEDVLLSGGVVIDADVRDDFDPKRDRLLKTIMTDDEALDRKIALAHTECYVMNEKVIYPSKVDVYKFAPKAEENQNKGE